MNSDLKKIGHYDVLKRLSSGGQGDVYLAKVEKPEFRFTKFVAIKMIQRKSGANIANEVGILTSLRHPHLCTILDVGSQDDFDFIVFEYIEGLDLKKFVKKAQEKLLELNEDAIVEIGSLVYGGLKYLHQTKGHPVLHKDISPQNIMVSVDGTVKIIDFGISILKNNISNTSRKIEGKPKYLPSSILNGMEDYSEHTDFYSLGAVLYELATNQNLIPGETATLDKIKSSKLRNVIQKLMHSPMQLSDNEFAFKDSNLRDVASKSFDEKFISEHTLTGHNNSSITPSNFPLKRGMLILGLISILLVGGIFAQNRSAKLYSLQGEYIMVRPSKDASTTSFNENISTSLKIQNNDIIKTETELHGCKIIQRWNASEYKNQILVIREATFEQYEEYSITEKKCIDNEKSKAMFSSGNDLAIRVELKIVDKMLHYRVLGLEGPFEEIYSRAPCRFYELNCWM